MAMEQMTPEETARKLAMAVAEHNENYPDKPITRADIEKKKRSGWLGKALLFCEGVWDGLTDKIPEDVLRLFRHGKIGEGPEDWKDRLIAQQEQDQKARIQSREEALGDRDAASWYETGREIPSNIIAGLPGALAGAPLGVIGGALGSALTTGAAYGAIAKDRFIEQMHKQFGARYGRQPDRIEAAMLNGAANKAANAYANEQALYEGGAQLATAIPGGYAARGAALGAGSLLSRAGLAEPAALAGELLARGGARTAENIAGENISPERGFDAEGVFRGLNFAPMEMKPDYIRAIDTDRIRRRSLGLEEDYAPARNFNTQYIEQQR